MSRNAGCTFVCDRQMDEVPSLINSGGYGTVHRASTEGFVVKKIPYDRGRVPFLLELSIMSTYKHPSINAAVRISWRSREIRIYQLEALCDLDLWLRTNNITHYLAKLWTYQLYAGLAILHADRIVHCDVKTRNILVTNDLSIKLADFGLAMRQASTFITREPAGTHGYTAPEVLYSGVQTTAADVWSAGIVACELLTQERTIPRQISTKTNSESHRLAVRCKTIRAIQTWRSNLGEDVGEFISCGNYLPITTEIIPTTFGKLVLAATGWSAKDRPTATAIINNPIFSSFSLEEVRTRHNIIAPFDNNHPLRLYLIDRNLERIDRAVQEESYVLFNRVRRHLNKVREICVIEAVLSMVANMYRYTIPGWISSQPEEVICDVIQDITIHLNYRLHQR